MLTSGQCSQARLAGEKRKNIKKNKDRIQKNRVLSLKFLLYNDWLLAAHTMKSEKNQKSLKSSSFYPGGLIRAGKKRFSELVLSEKYINQKMTKKYQSNNNKNKE